MPRLLGAFLSSIAVLAVVAAFAGCGSREATKPGHPLNVTVNLDQARTAIRPVGAAGGVLTAVAADGTKFTLEIPQNALTVDTPIMMTPVSSISGLPFKNGWTGAVQFGPEGLQLSHAARLTIDPVKPIPPPQRVGFGYFGEGRDFHLEPLDRRSSKIQLAIVHFSGAGASQGNSSDADGVAPVDAQAQAAQMLAQLIAEARRNNSEKSTNDLVKDLSADLFARYQEQLKAALKRGCVSANGVIRQALQLQNMLEGLGIEDPSASAFFESDNVHNAADTCRKEKEKDLDTACAAGNSTESMVQAFRDVFNADKSKPVTGSGSPSDTDALLELQEKCNVHGWTGTITASTVKADTMNLGDTKVTSNESLLQKANLGKVEFLTANGESSTATMEGTLDGTYNSNETSSTPAHHLEPQCPAWAESGKNSTTESLSGSGSTKARVTIAIDHLNVTVDVMPASDDEIEVSGNSTVQGIRKREYCRDGVESYSESKELHDTRSFEGTAFKTTLDPANPNMLKGSTTYKDGNSTTTITWDLKR